MTSSMCLLVMNCALRAIDSSPVRRAAAVRLERLISAAADFNVTSLSIELAGNSDFRVDLVKRRGVKSVATETLDASHHAISAAGNRPSRQRFLVCGFEAHISVFQTVTGLLQRGANVLVVADAIAASSEIDRFVAMQRMAEAGAALTTAEMLTFEWMSTFSRPVCRNVLAALAPAMPRDEMTEKRPACIANRSGTHQSGESSIGNQIRNARLARGLHLTDLGRLANCSLPHLSKIENSKGRPPLKLLMRISKALGKDITYFLGSGALIKRPLTTDVTP